MENTLRSLSNGRKLRGGAVALQGAAAAQVVAAIFEKIFGFFGVGQGFLPLNPASREKRVAKRVPNRRIDYRRSVGLSSGLISSAVPEELSSPRRKLQRSWQ
jgi:hypothetical protein